MNAVNRELNLSSNRNRWAHPSGRLVLLDTFSISDVASIDNSSDASIREGISRLTSAKYFCRCFARCNLLEESVVTYVFSGGFDFGGGCCGGCGG